MSAFAWKADTLGMASSWRLQDSVFLKCLGVMAPTGEADRRVTMTPLEPYYRQRARAERATAHVASSPQARLAHLELALRYTKIAEGFYGAARGAAATDELNEGRRPATASTVVESALRSAFPLPGSGNFSDLLKMID